MKNKKRISIKHGVYKDGTTPILRKAYKMLAEEKLKNGRKLELTKTLLELRHGK